MWCVVCVCRGVVLCCVVLCCVVWCGPLFCLVTDRTDKDEEKRRKTRQAMMGQEGTFFVLSCSISIFLPPFSFSSFSQMCTRHRSINTSSTNEVHGILSRF